MCRISGYFDVGVALPDLRCASRQQRHGGPDAHSAARGTGWALAVERLAIVDLNGGSQPYDLDGLIKVAFNGEIYNHAALRRRLRVRGYRIDDRCDGSILPALYSEYGVGFAEHLDGMYAIAVVDLRAEPRVVLVTDDLGMKPLYYQWDRATGELHFASELPALLAFRRVDRALFLGGLDAYLSTKTPFGEQTMFERIRALPPATTAVLTRGGGLSLSKRETCPASDPALDAGPDLDAAGSELRALLIDEVRQLLRADIRVSLITSGGLDSSLLTAIAAETTPGLHTFNIAYRGRWPHDERAFAAAVAARANTHHHQVELDPDDIPQLLAEVVWHLGQPNADPIAVSSYALFAAVRAAGFKVAISGDGADELFGGYDRLRAAMAAPAGADWVPAYVDGLAAIPRSLRSSLYSTEYRRYIEVQGSAADRLTDELASSARTRLETLTEFEVGRRLPAYHLRRVDHMSMAHGVEVRLPFCQPRVSRFARALAPSLRTDGHQVKRALYRAADGLLPASVLARPKQPFTLPIAAMLRPRQPLFDHAREALSAANLRTQAQVNPASVQRLLARQARRPSERDALAVWSLLILGSWMSQFDNPQHVLKAAA